MIAGHLQAHGRTPDTARPLRCETLGDDVAALIGHLKLRKADVVSYSLGSPANRRQLVDTKRRLEE